MEYDNSYEVTWIGSLISFGKEEAFIIEHLIFEKDRIVGYMMKGDDLYALKGTFTPPKRVDELSSLKQTFKGSEDSGSDR
jgi:hypothetical protein